LSLARLLGLIAAFWLIVQVVAIFVIPGVADGSAYGDAQAAMQLHLVPDRGGVLIATWAIVRLGCPMRSRAGLQCPPPQRRTNLATASM
jgi:cytochrome b561